MILPNSNLDLVRFFISVFSCISLETLQYNIGTIAGFFVVLILVQLVLSFL